MKQTVILDFDGVVHSYTSGWMGPDVIPDPPVPGTREAIDELRKKYTVVIISSRCYHPGGMQAMTSWLARHGITVDLVTDHKPPHICVVDDRALRFEGDWEAVLDGIEAASIPWNHKEKPAQP